ncbi:TPA: CvpA family protein [bacterium]|nr:CvpA family protein [bacterium]
MSGSKISIDIVSVIFILLGLLWGIRKGFLRSSFFLIGILAGIYIGNLCTRFFTADISNRFIISRDIAGAIVFIIVFFLALSLINGLGLLIKRPKRGLGKFIDRLGGGVIGIFWGFGICGFLGIILSRYEATKNLMPSTIIIGIAEFWVRKIVEGLLSYGTW